MPWSPLARGRLARRWENEPRTQRGKTDEYGNTLYEKTKEADKKIVDAVSKISEARGIPHAQVSLAWLLSKPVVTAPIVGATKLIHIDDAVAAVSLKLTDEEINKLEENYVAHSGVGVS